MFGVSCCTLCFGTRYIYCLYSHAAQCIVLWWSIPVQSMRVRMLHMLQSCAYYGQILLYSGLDRLWTNRCVSIVITSYCHTYKSSIGYLVLLYFPIFGGWQISCRDIMRPTCTEYHCPTLITLERFSVTPDTFSPIQRPSADYSHPHSGNFGNFLRLLPFALVSVFL
jgi:hypothetical protein